MQQLSGHTKFFIGLLIVCALYILVFEIPHVEPTHDNILGKWQNDYGDTLIIFGDGKLTCSGPTFSDKSEDFNNTDIKGRWFLETNEFNHQTHLRIRWSQTSDTIFLQVVVHGFDIYLRFSEDEMEKDLYRKEYTHPT